LAMRAGTLRAQERNSQSKQSGIGFATGGQA
jgi:hypothetical protein